MKIDKEDQCRVNQFRWSSQGRYLRIARKWDGKLHNIYLHHFLIGRPIDRKLEVDHINRNPLDNRKCNLRFVTREENMKNIKPALGIYWDKDRNKWVAQNNFLTNVYLGSYKNKKDALSAYRKSRTTQDRKKK